MIDIIYYSKGYYIKVSKKEDTKHLYNYYRLYNRDDKLLKDTFNISVIDELIKVLRIKKI